MNARVRRWFLLCVALQAAIVLVMVAKKQAVLLYGKTIVLKTTPVDPRSLFRGDYARLATPIHTPDVSQWGPDWPKRGNTIYAELSPSGTSWHLVKVHPRIPEGMPEDHVALKGKATHVRQWRGQEVTDLEDLSQPGWLNMQPATATWRRGRTGRGGRRGLWYRGTKLPEGSIIYVELYSHNKRRWNISGISNEREKTPRAYPNSVTLQGRVGPHEESKSIQAIYGIETFFVPEGKGRKHERRGLDVEVAVSRGGTGVVKRVILPEDG
ncbi:GDYXXLXY domain-containing protein [Elusimicrobiota bacterium]